MSTIDISTPARFAFEATVISHGWYLLAPFRWDGTGKVLHRVEDFSGRALDLSIRGGDKRLIVETSTGDAVRRPGDPQGRPYASVETELRERLRRMFQLHVDISDFLQLCRSSGSHAHVARVRFGRLLCGSTLFEDAVKIITTTNTTWRQTMRMVDLIVTRYGAKSRTGGHAFPTPAALASASLEDLREHCRLGYRSSTIRALAKGIADGSINLTEIADSRKGTEELFRSYQKLPGIGPYGAAHLLAMDGRHDFIAVDTEFRRFVRERHFRGRNVSDRTMLKRYKQWGKWQYLAYWSELWNQVSRDLEQFEKATE